MHKYNKKGKSVLGRSSSIIPIVNASAQNYYSEFSSNSSLNGKTPVTEKEVTEEYNRRVILEIINNYFDVKKGNYNASSTTCSTPGISESDDSVVDNRLMYWKNMLRERKLIQQTIQKKTGKKPADILFNRRSTIEDRDKETIKQVIEYAERMKPILLLKKEKAKLAAYFDPDTCMYINEIVETLPKAESDAKKNVEISGIPNIIRQELLGPIKIQGETKNSWLQSKVLSDRLVKHFEDIKRVIEYYPDIESLQVVGKKIKHQNFIDRDIIRYDGVHDMDFISDDTQIEIEKDILESVEEVKYPIQLGIKINEHVFTFKTKLSSKSVEVETFFTCSPFERKIKTVLQIENIGQQMINFEWTSRSYYNKPDDNLYLPKDNEFFFETENFHLSSGEISNVIVLYQPRKVAVVKQKWSLRLLPHIFCGNNSIILKFTGKCTPAKLYIDKINEEQKNSIDKSNKKAMCELTTSIGFSTPLIKPYEVYCPYKRELNERDIFNFKNVGYNCERFDDLEKLKSLFQRVKQPCERFWDLHVDSLKQLIFHQCGPDRRELLFAELVHILETIKGTPVHLMEKYDCNPERDHTRFIYVRGILCNSIEEWESLIFTLESNVLKLEMQRYYAKLWEGDEAEENQEESYEVALENLFSDWFMEEKRARELVLKKLRRTKSYRDSLYMQTYIHLGAVAENIVSVIESTQ